jgi:branched-chain amino acid transport system permease protein
LDFDAFFTQFWASTIDGLTIGSIYALVALGYTLVYGVLRLINFAHSEVFMIGIMATLFTFTTLGVTSPAGGFTLVLFLLLAAVVAAAASGGTAVVLERVAYRRLRKQGASRLAALISAIGASLFLQEAFGLGYSRDFESVPSVMEKVTWAEIGTGTIRNDKLLVFVGAVLMMFALDRFVNGSKLGRGIRATAQDPESAVLMGVNIDRVVVTTFLLGGLMAGVGGMLFGVFFEVTKFTIGFLLGIKAFTAAVLGGIGNLRGALLGGLVLGLVESYGTSILGTAWRDVIAFAILVLILLFRPTGLLGESLERARA